MTYTKADALSTAYFKLVKLRYKNDEMGRAYAAYSGCAQVHIATAIMMCPEFAKYMHRKLAEEREKCANR